jgi:hypothetical protein
MSLLECLKFTTLGAYKIKKYEKMDIFNIKQYLLPRGGKPSDILLLPILRSRLVGRGGMKWNNPTPSLPKVEGVNLGFSLHFGEGRMRFFLKMSINNEIFVSLENDFENY